MKRIIQWYPLWKQFCFVTTSMYYMIEQLLSIGSADNLAINIKKPESLCSYKNLHTDVSSSVNHNYQKCGSS